MRLHIPLFRNDYHPRIANDNLGGSTREAKLEFVRRHKVLTALIVFLALWIIVVGSFVFLGSGSGGLDVK